MMASAHRPLMSRLDKFNAFGVTDRDTEEYLIQHGYTRYTQRPLMLLTPKGVAYARQNEKWLKNGRRAG